MTDLEQFTKIRPIAFSYNSEGGRTMSKYLYLVPEDSQGEAGGKYVMKLRKKHELSSGFPMSSVLRYSIMDEIPEYMSKIIE